MVGDQRVLDLLDEGEVLGQFGRDLCGRGRGLVEVCREDSDELGIEPVILGAPQPGPGEGLHLGRLQPDGGNAPIPQMFDEAPFIAARRLEPDAPDLVGGEEAVEFGQASAAVGEDRMRAARPERHVELVLRHIDSSATYDSLVVGHLLDPRLGFEPCCSSNHPGRKKMPMAIQLPYSAKALGR